VRRTISGDFGQAFVQNASARYDYQLRLPAFAAATRGLKAACRSQ